METMEPILFEAIFSQINATLFGYESPKDLFEDEFHNKDIDTPLTVIRDLNIRSKRTDDAVMYVNINSGATENACPSIADSSAVSLGMISYYMCISLRKLHICKKLTCLPNP